MAKKDKAGKRIPKTIGGLKIPKELRKSGEALIATATSPQGRKMIGAGLAMVAATIATKAHAPTREPDAGDEGLRDKPVTDTAPHLNAGAPVPPVPPVPPVAPVPRAGGERPPLDPDRIVEAVTAATGAFFDGLFGRKR
ncbi:hypothetical protein [Sphingomonas sp. RS2018]